MTQKEINVREIAKILCGSSLIADIYSNGIWYFETNEFIYRIQVSIVPVAGEMYLIRKFTDLSDGAKEIWAVSMNFNLDAMKKIFKILNQ